MATTAEVKQAFTEALAPIAAQIQATHDHIIQALLEDRARFNDVATQLVNLEYDLNRRITLLDPEQDGKVDVAPKA